MYTCSNYTRGGRSRLTFTNQVSLKSRVAQYCRLRNARFKLVQYSPLTVLDFFTISPRLYHLENGFVRRRGSLLLCLEPEPLNRPSATAATWQSGVALSCRGAFKGSAYESIFKVIEPGRYSEKVQKRSMESTILNVHYVIYSTELHVTLMRPD